MNGKKILITGGAGFVAGRIAEILSATNEVTVVDNLRYWDTTAFPKGCKHLRMDIGDVYIVEEYDLVIHGATVNIIEGMSYPKACVDTNWTQPTAVIGRSPQDTPILYLSTSAIDGNGISIPTNEMCRVAPSSVYAMTKLMAEMYLKDKHPNCYILRLSNVFGPRQHPQNPYSGVMVKILESAITGKPFTVYGDGSQTRDFTYVDDVVSAVTAILEKGKKGEVYNVGSGVETSIAQLMQYLTKDTEVIAKEGRAIDNITRRCMDIKKIKMDTGWEPKTSLKDGFDKTVIWLMQNNLF